VMGGLTASPTAPDLRGQLAAVREWVERAMPTG
jgi:hypothetical protein